MSEGDLDSNIQDYMLFGSGLHPEDSITENSDQTECVPLQDEISGHNPLCPKIVKVISSLCMHQQSDQCSASSTCCCPHCFATHDKSQMLISPVRKVQSEVHTRSCENYGSSLLVQNKSEVRNNEALNLDGKLIKQKKFDVASQSTKKQERQLMIKGDQSSYETHMFSLRTRKCEYCGETVECSLSKEYNETKKLTSDLSQKPCQIEEVTAECELGQRREIIQELQRNSLNINYSLFPAPEINNEVEPQSFNPYYTCQAELQTGDQLITNKDSETCIVLSSIAAEVTVKERVTPGDIKESNDASNIPPQLKEDSSFAQDDSHYFFNSLVSQDDEDNHLVGENNDSVTHLSFLNNRKTSVPYNQLSAKVTDAASSMDGSSLNAASLYGDDLEQDLDNASDVADDVVSDVATDFDASDKVRTHVMTKDNTGSDDVVRTLIKGGTDEEARNMYLTSKDKDPMEMMNISYLLNKTDERLEDFLLESMANSNNGLHSDQSTRSDFLAENTQVKELNDDYELYMVNEDYVQLFNRHEKQINRTSLNLQGQHVSTDPNSLVNLRAHHPNIPGVSVIYRLRDDIRNILVQDGHSQQHPRSDNEYVPEHGVNVYASESPNAVSGQPVQLQEINYNYPQYGNRYTLENSNLPSTPHNGIHLPQGANKLLVGNTERSMEDSSESNAEAPRNGRSEESLVCELTNEFRDVKVEDYNSHKRETEFPVYRNELSLSDRHIFGGPDDSSLPHPHALESISCTAHQHSLENTQTFFQNEERREIVPSTKVTPPVLTVADSFWPHQSINETSERLDADSSNCNQENHISGEMSVPVQEAPNRSLSYESLHRVQERPLVFNRQTSCPSTESETNSASFDVGLQRDFELALELQQQLNHEFFMEDEAFAIHLDNSQRQTLSPPPYDSRRTRFGSWAEQMINLNPQRRQRRPQHSNRLPGRHRRESAANRDGQRTRDQNLEDMISLHENNRGHTHHSHGNSQGNPQGEIQHRGAVAGANVADSRIPFDSEFQSVRDNSVRATIRDRPMPHWFEQQERVARIPGQSAQIDPSIITPLTRNYQEERRQREEQRRQLEAREWEHEYSYQQQNWRGGHDLLPNEDYPSLDVHHSYYDPDEVFQLEDGDQYASITQDAFVLRRLLMTRRPNFEMPHNLENYDELWNLVEMLGDVRQQGLSQTHIEMLPVHTFCEVNSGESKECNICLNAYSDGDEIRTLTCLHMFHTACIDEWLNRNAACPVCRQRVEIDSSE